MRRMWMTGMMAVCCWACPMEADAQAVVADTVYLRLNIDSVGLEEVVVEGRKTPPANSRWSDMHPVELVTVGGANGDLYKALQTLPGTQVQGESGRLLVRGGSSEETQTFIDGMHVLNPYTSTGPDTPARSRYSTFMFSGINLASGGAPPEYGQALSAVLPLETKDSSPVNKLGLNASVVGVGGGGTRAFGKGSLSVDLNCQHLGLYDRLFPGRRDFEEPYRLLSGAAQLRLATGEATLLKLYAQYDRTDFSSYEGGDRRLFALGEDNVYLNATCRRRAAGRWEWFAGAAYSRYARQVAGAVQSGDRWLERRQELHLKAKAAVRPLPVLRLEAGMEGYVRCYEGTYRYQGIGQQADVSPRIAAAFLSASCFLTERLKAELSLRGEYTLPARRPELSPRLALGYLWGELLLSASAGRYTQLPADTCLSRTPRLRSEVCVQYNAGIRYARGGRFYKAECYYKDYTRLALADGEGFNSGGYGYSKGIDLFFRDEATVRNLTYQLAYTYNLARRKYGAYAELTTPQYATRHHLAVVLKYSIPALRTIVGLTDTYTSGRPYHNPGLPGLMNDEVKPYNSLDLGLTFIPGKKVIVHASVTNLLGRRNEFGRVDGRPVLASDDRTFYVGVFVTLGRRAAYDVSNF